MADDLFGVFDEDANEDNESIALGAYTLNNKLKETEQNLSKELIKSEKKTKRKLDQIENNDDIDKSNISEEKDNEQIDILSYDKFEARFFKINDKNLTEKLQNVI